MLVRKDDNAGIVVLLGMPINHRFHRLMRKLDLVRQVVYDIYFLAMRTRTALFFNVNPFMNVAKME